MWDLRKGKTGILKPRAKFSGRFLGIGGLGNNSFSHHWFLLVFNIFSVCSPGYPGTL